MKKPIENEETKSITTSSESPISATHGLRAIAKQFSGYLNKAYKESVSYNPNTGENISLVVNKWVEMPKQYQERMDMPGLPFGVITQVYGKKDSGKTSMLMQGIAAAQKQGILPILILSEHKFDFLRLTDWMDADPEAIIVFEVDDLESGFTFLEKILRDIYLGKLILETDDKDDKGEKKDLVIDVSNQPCYIFWDSIGGTLSRSELEGEVEDWSKDMGRGAQALKKMVKRSAYLLHRVKDRVGILFLNQVWTARTPTGISYDKPAGGEAVQHYYAVEIHLKRGTEVRMESKGKDMGIGYNIEMRVVKNHITHTRLTSSFIAVAEGLLDPKELDNFKKRYRQKMK